MQTVAIIGIGLVGGSIAAKLRSVNPQWRIIGINRSREPLAYALEKGLITEAAENIEQGVKDADLIFIATPVSTIAAMVEQVAAFCKQGAIVTDVGSTKAGIVSQAEAALDDRGHFVGGHPMAGSEKSGVEAARPDLFKMAYYILTPTDKTDTEAYRTVHRTVSSLGAFVLALSPVEHDQTIAAISHVPHFTSACLVEVANRYIKGSQDLMQIAAGGFRDMTRIAAGDPDMWRDIAMSNQAAIYEGLKELSLELSCMADTINDGDAEKIFDILYRAQKIRLNLPHVKEKDILDLHELSIDVPDRPGVLSDVTVAIGSLGINIENIEIIHSSEKLTGSLRLLIIGEADANRAASVLQSKGFSLAVNKVYDS